MQDDGKIGGHTGLAPVNYKSHTQLVQLWRARGNQYSGASGNLLKWQERMIQLKYARKGNSGTIEGCTSYSYQYTAAIDAEGVNYFPVTTEQAANLLIDSYVAIGTHTKSTTDRNDATMHDIQTEARITRIEDILNRHLKTCLSISNVQDRFPYILVDGVEMSLSDVNPNEIGRASCRERV